MMAVIKNSMQINNTMAGISDTTKFVFRFYQIPLFIFLILFITSAFSGCIHTSYTTLQRQKALKTLNNAKINGGLIYNKDEYESAEKLYKQGIEKQKQNRIAEANTLFSFTIQLAKEITNLAKENKIKAARQKKFAFAQMDTIKKQRKKVVLDAILIQKNTPLHYIRKIRIYTVVKGDCLWNIAKKKQMYNDPLLWSLIYKETKTKSKIQILYTRIKNSLYPR